MCVCLPSDVIRRHIYMQIQQPAFPAPNSSLQMMCHYNELYLNKFNTSLIKEENVLKGHTPNQAAGLAFRLLAQGGGENYFMDKSFSSNLYLHFYSLIKFYFITHCKHTHTHTHTHTPHTVIYKSINAQRRKRAIVNQLT